MNVATLILVLSLLGPLLVFVVNPLCVWLASLGRQASRPGPVEGLAVSVIVVVRNGAELIGPKLENTLGLAMPGPLQVLVYVDGDEDGTAQAVATYVERGVVLLPGLTHLGKTHGMNEAVRHATGSVLLFSDADAILEPDAVVTLARHFADPRIGGVSGLRVVGEKRGDFAAAQSGYISADSRLKVWESRLGAITGNDGKLYAVRRELYQDVAERVMDDFYVCLSVVAQGCRFIFEPAARALIRMPSRTAAHELERRRRIVSASLNTIRLHRQLLNPFAFGGYSLRLFVNKVLRRLLPVFLAGLFTSSLALALQGRQAAAALFWLQVAGYALALTGPRLSRSRAPRPLRKIASLGYYFCVGNLGSLLGAVDFALGRQPAKWTPKKSDVQLKP
jgi:cellulose synthase/poly-beta-1,6-N-acetylglucosamine synthase-like glycosyltransferase